MDRRTRLHRALDHVLDCAGMAGDAWQESKHPRKSGQFAPVTHKGYTAASHEGGYVAASHPKHGTVAAGTLTQPGYGHGGTHVLSNLEMTEERFKHNAIRQPAMESLIRYMEKNYGKYSGPKKK